MYISTLCLLPRNCAQEPTLNMSIQSGNITSGVTKSTYNMYIQRCIDIEQNIATSSHYLSMKLM
jgi:hypothetical protein